MAGGLGSSLSERPFLRRRRTRVVAVDLLWRSSRPADAADPAAPLALGPHRRTRLAVPGFALHHGPDAERRAALHLPRRRSRWLRRARNARRPDAAVRRRLP